MIKGILATSGRGKRYVIAAPIAPPPNLEPIPLPNVISLNSDRLGKWKLNPTRASIINMVTSLKMLKTTMSLVWIFPIIRRRVSPNKTPNVGGNSTIF